MRLLFHHLRARAATRSLTATTFCETCGQVCTPDCRREALYERHLDDLRRAGIFRR